MNMLLPLVIWITPFIWASSWVVEKIANEMWEHFNRYHLRKYWENRITLIHATGYGHAPTNASTCGKPSVIWLPPPSVEFPSLHAGDATSHVLLSIIFGRLHHVSGLWRLSAPYRRSFWKFLLQHSSSLVVNRSELFFLLLRNRPPLGNLFLTGGIKRFLKLTKRHSYNHMPIKL